MPTNTITMPITPVNDIFAGAASKYFEAGYNVLPLRKGTKIPFMPNWQQWCETRQAAFTVESWEYTYPDCNIGVPLGIISNIIAIDFDYDIDGLHTKIINILGAMPVKKKGAKGFTAFFRYNGESPKKWYKEGKAVLELLSTGNQTVMPPSMHPDTKNPYIWITPDTLLDIEASELPALPDGFLEKMDNLFGYEKKMPRYNTYEGEIPELSEVEKALSFIPSAEYATWITCGMALHHTYAGGGFDAWDAWSRKAPNYDSKGMQAKWASFGRGKTIVTIGTIFHFAIGYGYMPPKAAPIFDFELTPDFKILTGSSLKGVNSPQLESLKIESHGLDFPEHLLDNAPGLPGEIAKWINSTSIKRQPILALGAAICAAGTIFAHKIRNDSNLRTNFMVLGLAESGAGKNHARECIKSLFQYCELSQYTFGKFASDAGLLNALDTTNGIGIALIDEIGREIKCLNGKGAGGHETRLLTLMMEIYSEAGTTYDGKRYASVENTKQLIQPCLNIYGTTVPKRFFDSMTSDESIDGFLARWLVFSSEDIDPPTQQRGCVELPPETLADNIRYIKTMTAYRPPVPGTVSAPIPEPRIITYTEGAVDILQKLTVACNENRIAEIKRGGNLAPIWARTRDLAIKLPLVAHPYRESIIEMITMQWACEVALHLANVAIVAIQGNISDSDYGKNLNRVYGVINRYNINNKSPMPHGKLSNSVRSIKQRDCNEILQHLVQSDRIRAIEQSTSGKVTYIYEVI